MSYGAESRGRSWFRCVEQSMQEQRVRAGVTEVPVRPFHKVPPYMRHANLTPYDPVFFAFGPCHAKFAVPPPSSELLKVQIAQVLTNQRSFQNLCGTIERQDRVVRQIYEEYLWELQFSIEPPFLAYLLALDALTLVAGALYPSKLRPPLRFAIYRDALLLEQQLPLFIIKAATESLDIPPDTASLKRLLDPPTDPPTSSPQYIDLYRTVTDDQRPPISSPVYMSAVVKFYGATMFSNLVGSKARKWVWEDPSDERKSMLSHIYHNFVTLPEPEAEADAAAQGERSAGVLDSKEIYSRISTASTLRRSGIQADAAAQGERSAGVLDSKEIYSRISTASTLRRSGIHFIVGDGGFRGIKFDAAKRVLTLPEMWIFDETKTDLLNLVAEEYLYSVPRAKETPVSSYIAVMDGLIDTEEDVQLLVDAKVIHNMLGSHEEVAKMWNSLLSHIPLSYTNNDKVVIQCVSKASRKCFHKCWAGFRDTYFDKKPWLFISIIAASCLFLLTFLQTTYTILQFNNQQDTLGRRDSP